MSEPDFKINQKPLAFIHPVNPLGIHQSFRTLGVLEATFREETAWGPVFWKYIATMDETFILSPVGQPIVRYALTGSGNACYRIST